MYIIIHTYKRQLSLKKLTIFIVKSQKKYNFDLHDMNV